MAAEKVIVMSVKGQTLTVDGGEGIVADSERYLYIQLRFGEEFSGCGKSVCFHHNGTTFVAVPDIHQKAPVPPEVIQAPGFYASVEFSNGDGMKSFTNEVFVEIEKSGCAKGSFPPDVTQDLYESIVQAVNQNAEYIASKADGLSYQDNLLQLKSGETKIGNSVEVSIVNENGSLINNYNALANRPKIEGVVLVGDKTLGELGIEASGAASSALADAKAYADQLKPTKVSELENDAGYLISSELSTAVATDIAQNHNRDADAHKAIYDSIYGCVPDTASGTSRGLYLPRSGRAGLNSLAIYGKSTQAGTPTPDKPADFTFMTGITWTLDNGKGATEDFRVFGLLLRSVPGLSGSTIAADKLELRNGKVLLTKTTYTDNLYDDLDYACTLSDNYIEFSCPLTGQLAENAFWGLSSHFTCSGGVGTFLYNPLNKTVGFKIGYTTLGLQSGCTKDAAIAALRLWVKAQETAGTPVRFLYAVSPTVTDVTASEEGQKVLKLKTLSPNTTITDAGNAEYAIEIGYNRDIREDYAAFKEDFYTHAGYNDAEVVGLEVDYKNKVCKRLAGAAGKEAGSDFDVFPMFGGRKRCNVADNGLITAYYGSPLYAEDGTNGQVMVYQPKFYYRVVPLETEQVGGGKGARLRKAAYYVSSKPKGGFQLHPAFYDEAGNETDYILFSAYEACAYDTSAGSYNLRDARPIDKGADKLSSIAGVKPMSNVNNDDLEKLAKNRGTGWHGDTVKAASANQLLMMIEAGTMNLQEAYSMGIVGVDDSNQHNCASLTGSTAELGNATGQATETINEINGVETTYNTEWRLAITYRGMENPWGNIAKYVNGINIVGLEGSKAGEPHICNDFVFNQNKKNGNYEPVGFQLPNGGGYISAMGYSTKFDWLFLPSECKGNSNLPVGDYLSAGTDVRGYYGLQYGSNWYGSYQAGGFCWNASYPSEAKLRTTGGRLLYVPQKKTA